MRGALGFFLLLVLAWALRERRGEYGRRIPWRTVIAGIALQIGLAVLLLRLPAASRVLLLFNRATLALQEATDQGTSFVFGYLGGGKLPFAETSPGASFILAFKVLPLVLVISALSARLYYWGVLQRVTQAFAWVLRRSMGISGALALGAAVDPALSRAHAARRAVRGHELRHGRRRRYGDGGLCDNAGPNHPECVGKHPDLLGHKHAGGARGCGADGAVRTGRRPRRDQRRRGACRRFRCADTGDQR